MNEQAAEVVDDTTAVVEDAEVTVEVTDVVTEAPAEDTGAPAKKSRYERRIGQLTAKAAQAVRDNEVLRERLDALEKRNPEPEPERPHADDFETASEYEDALFDWRDNVKEFKAPKETPAQPEISPEMKSFEDKLEALNPEAKELVFTDDYPCTDQMVDFYLESDKGAEIAFHIASNPEEADRIAKLSPVGQARELVTIEQNLAQTISSSAPPPGGHLRPGGKTDIDPDTLSADEWRVQREAEIAARE
jgi:hypothetical protein